MWQQIEHSISEKTRRPFKAETARPVAGGCINEAFCLQGQQRCFFVKVNRAERLDMFAAEAAGLRAIQATNTVRVPRAIAWDSDRTKSWLVLEFIAFSSQQPSANAALGEQLAAMHQVSAGRFGWERNNTIGSSVQSNNWMEDWPDFLREQRLGYQLALAGLNHAPTRLIDRGQQLLELLPALFSDYQPQPALLHGDLWGGNWATDEQGLPVLFDPAVYFGDREADLAMTELFGGFDKRFYESYHAAWPLDPGYRVRKHAYNLYHILNHFNLFGGSYAQQASDMIENLLAHLSR